MTKLGSSIGPGRRRNSLSRHTFDARESTQFVDAIAKRNHPGRKNQAGRGGDISTKSSHPRKKMAVLEVQGDALRGDRADSQPRNVTLDWNFAKGNRENLVPFVLCVKMTSCWCDFDAGFSGGCRFVLRPLCWDGGSV